METKKLLYPILVVILLALSFGLGFSFGSKKAKIIQVEREVTKVLEPKASKLIEKRYYNITGFVKEIDYQNRIVTLTMDGDETKVKIESDKVMSYAARHVKPGQQGPSEVTFKDIAVGDKLSTFAEEKENGELVGTNVYLHFLPE
jgi:predicted metalloprotease